MKFSLFCSVILSVVCIVDIARADTRRWLPPQTMRIHLNCNFFCYYVYGGSKEELGKCMKECEAANGRTEKEVLEEARNIDYDCNLMPDWMIKPPHLTNMNKITYGQAAIESSKPDLSSIPTKHWHALFLKCQAEESKKYED